MLCSHRQFLPKYLTHTLRSITKKFSTRISDQKKNVHDPSINLKQAHFEILHINVYMSMIHLQTRNYIRFSNFLCIFLTTTFLELQLKKQKTKTKKLHSEVLQLFLKQKQKKRKKNKNNTQKTYCNQNELKQIHEPVTYGVFIHVRRGFRDSLQSE